METVHKVTDTSAKDVCLPLSKVIEEVRLHLDKVQTDSRKAHTFAVERMAERLGALLLPEKILELRLAALLHDITKDMDDNEQETLCRRYKISLSPEELLTKKTLHARTGAYYAREHFAPYISEEIFHAIYRHTVGAANMTTFEKIIFLADLIEETRTYPFCIEMRNRIFRDFSTVTKEEALLRLDQVLFLSFQNTLSSFSTRGLPIASDTVHAYNSLISSRKKE